MVGPSSWDYQGSDGSERLRLELVIAAVSQHRRRFSCSGRSLRDAGTRSLSEPSGYGSIGICVVLSLMTAWTTRLSHRLLHHVGSEKHKVFFGGDVFKPGQTKMKLALMD